MADTFIEATEPTTDHGGLRELEVDRGPGRITYLKFDLRTAPNPIRRATLSLFCINGSSDAGTIYPVSDSSWEEGSGDGSALGNGLAWSQVDSNGDGRVDTRDPSPFVPDFARPIAALGDLSGSEWVTVDVTAALQNGPQLYTLAILGGNNDGSVYGSRTHPTAARRPVLTIEPASANYCGDGVTGEGEECDDGNTIACDGCSPTCTDEPASSCGALSPIADTYIEAKGEARWDHGASDHLDADADPAGITYLKFDLRDVATPIRRATLVLFCTNASREGGTLYPVPDSSWIEGTARGVSDSSAAGPGLKWTDVDTNDDDTIDGDDTSPFVPNESRPLAIIGPVVAGQSYRVDVTAAFQSGPALYTLAIRSPTANGTTYSSRENSDPTERPLLLLEQ
jgi:cysteine-rich repeat protein